MATKPRVRRMFSITTELVTKSREAALAKFQACCLNYNDYAKKLFGEEYGIDKHLAFSLQFSSISQDQAAPLPTPDKMTDLFPPAVMGGLEARFVERFKVLSYVERVALALAASEGTVNHARLRSVTSEHPVDLSRTLQHLTQAGMLESTGGRGAVYHLPGELIPTPEDIFGAAPGISAQSSPNLAGSSPNLADRRDADGCLLSDQLSFPIIDDLTILSWMLRLRLEELASEPRAKGKISREKMIEVILRLCERHFVTLRCLAELVRRKPDTLRDQYLSVLYMASCMLTQSQPCNPHNIRLYVAIVRHYL